ncbi:hypothetical protein CRUP_003906, partial [Coryphaenoides rupestris]
ANTQQQRQQQQQEEAHEVDSGANLDGKGREVKPKTSAITAAASSSRVNGHTEDQTMDMDTQPQGQQAAVPVFQPQKPLQPDMGHNSLANFQIEKKIGRGQFSEVYRARYLLDNTSVALKKVQ